MEFQQIPFLLYSEFQSKHKYVNNRAAEIFLFTCSFFHSIIPVKLSQKSLLFQVCYNVNYPLLFCPFFLVSQSFYISNQTDLKKINKQRVTIIACLNKHLNGKNFTNFPLRNEYFYPPTCSISLCSIVNICLRPFRASFSHLAYTCITG